MTVPIFALALVGMFLLCSRYGTDDSPGADPDRRDRRAAGFRAGAAQMRRHDGWNEDAPARLRRRCSPVIGSRSGRPERRADRARRLEGAPRRRRRGLRRAWDAALGLPRSLERAAAAGDRRIARLRAGRRRSGPGAGAGRGAGNGMRFLADEQLLGEISDQAGRELQQERGSPAGSSRPITTSASSPGSRSRSIAAGGPTSCSACWSATGMMRAGSPPRR